MQILWCQKVIGHSNPRLFQPKFQPRTSQPQTFQPWTLQPQTPIELKILWLKSLDLRSAGLKCPATCIRVWTFQHRTSQPQIFQPWTLQIRTFQPWIWSFKVRNWKLGLKCPATCGLGRLFHFHGYVAGRRPWSWLRIVKFRAALFLFLF